MAWDEVRRLGAGDLTRVYRDGELSPPEVVEALIGAAEQRGPALNLFSVTCFERAMAEARHAATVLARQDEPRPLEGVPLVVKDLFDTAGVETAYGSPIFAGNVPERDAAVVRLARAAGAIVLAKTSTDEFAYGIASHNPHLGPVRNPWAPDRVSGGSSGGSAAALAAGVAPLALGSDTGGSIRAPAAFCGVAGVKPSCGAVSNEGLFPMARSLDHSGPMARAPGDARLLLEAIADRRALRLGGNGRPRRPARLVVCPDLHIAPRSAEVEAAFSSLVEVAEELAIEVVERPFPGAERIFPTFLTIQRFETSLTHRSRGLYPERRDAYGEDVRERLDVAATVTLEEYWRAEAERRRLRLAFDELLRGRALLLTSVQSTVPAEIGAADVEERTRQNVMDQTVPQNLAGLPACTIRAGFDGEGIPVGAQIVGARGADAAVLDAAELLCAATPALQNSWPGERDGDAPSLG